MSDELEEDKSAPIATGTFGMVHRAQLNGVGPVVIKRSRLLLMKEADRVAHCDKHEVPLIHKHPFTADLSHEAHVNMVVSRAPHPHIVRMVGFIHRPIGGHYHDVSVSQGIVFERWTGTYGDLLDLAHGRSPSGGRGGGGGGGGGGSESSGLHALPPRVDVAAWLRLLVRVLLDALLGVRHLHSLGYAHCDLSLGNVLWRPRWDAGVGSGAVEGAVSDLGTATSLASATKIPRNVKSPDEAHLHHLPSAHEMRGPKTDVFSAGAFLYAIGTRSTELCGLSAPESDEEFAAEFPDVYRPEADVTKFIAAYQHADARTQDHAARLHGLSLACVAPLQKRITLDELCDGLADLLRGV